MNFAPTEFRETGVTLYEDKAKQLLMALHPGEFVGVCWKELTELRRSVNSITLYGVETARVILNGDSEPSNLNLPEGLVGLWRPIFRLGVESLFESVPDTDSRGESLGARFGLVETLTQLLTELSGSHCPSCGKDHLIGGLDQYLRSCTPDTGRLIAVLPWSHKWGDVWDNLALSDALEMYGASRVLLKDQLVAGEQLSPLLRRKISSFENERLGIVIDSVSMPLSTESRFSFVKAISSLIGQGNGVELYHVRSSAELTLINLLTSGKICLYCGRSKSLDEAVPSIEGVSLGELLSGSLSKLEAIVNKSAPKIAEQIQPILSLLFDCGFGGYSLSAQINNFSPGELYRLYLAEFFSAPLHSAILWLDYSSEVLEDEELLHLLSRLAGRIAEQNVAVLISWANNLNSASATTMVAKPKHVTATEGALSFDSSIGAITIYPQRFNLLTGRSGVGKTRLLKEMQSKFLSDSWSDARYIGSPLAVFSPLDSVAGVLGLSSKISKAFLDSRDVKLMGFGKDDFNLDRSRYRCSECLGSGLSLAKGFGDFSSPSTKCAQCDGVGWSSELLNYRLRDLSIEQVRDMRLDRIREIFALDRNLSELVSIAGDFGIGELKLGQPLVTLDYPDLTLLNILKTIWERRVLKRSVPRLLLIDANLDTIPNTQYSAISDELRQLLNAGDTIVLVAPTKFENWGDSVVELKAESGSNIQARHCVVVSERCKN